MKKGFHHVAFACRDVEATVHFYETLLGFPLVHTEMDGKPEGFMRHIFFDLGDGSCIAFFQLNDANGPGDYKTDISTGMDLPVWVNHVAFQADEEKQEGVKATLAEAGIEPLMEVDHGWCHSVYFVDPNGIMVEFCRDTPGIVPDGEKAKSMLTQIPSA